MNAGTTTQALRSICTPEQHAQANKTKPVALVELGHGPYGKTALLEFPDGWQRTIDLVTPYDGWHPLFADLAVGDRQRLRGHTTPEFANHPDGTQSRPDLLSFVRRVQSARGKFLRWDHFEVPAQDFYQGAVTGYQCAAELLEALALGHGPHIQLNRLLQSAAQASGEGFQKTNRRAAGNAFMEIVGEALNYFATHTMHRPWLAKKIDGAEQDAQEDDERLAMERTEFVQRMKAGKAKKKGGAA